MSVLQTLNKKQKQKKGKTIISKHIPLKVESWTSRSDWILQVTRLDTVPIMLNMFTVGLNARIGSWFFCTLH